MESVDAIARKIVREALPCSCESCRRDRDTLAPAIASALRAERDNATRAVTDRFLRLVTEVCPNPNCAGEFSSDDGLRRWLRASMSYFGREAPEGCHAPKGHVLDDSGTVRKEADITSERSLTETANAAAVNAYAKVRELEALLDGAKSALAAERAKLEKEPSAWRVYCPPQHECEFLVFWDRQDAEIKAEEFNDALPEGEARYFVEPLFAQAAEAAKEKK